MRIYTIGHSTRQLQDLIDLLLENGVATLADIRRYPGSRRYPHFSRDSLAASLPAAGVDYLHLVELGGRRAPRPDTPNTAYRNEQFRGYADHMNTDEFRAGIECLLTAKQPAAVMCSEAVPWRCHRQLVSDELVRRGHEVIHILGPRSTKAHQMTPSARDRGTHLEYPG